MAMDLVDGSAAGGGRGDIATHLWTFLDRLSPAMYNRLYTSPASCLSIFRLLPLSARHIVLDMLWYDEIVRIRDVALWIRERRSEGAEKGERRHLKYTLSALQRLHIVTSRLDRHSDPSTDETELQMNSVFQNSFRMALTGGGQQGSFGKAAKEQDPEVTVQFLDDYAETQWEIIQHFMVGSDAGATKPGEKVLVLLNRSGLMASTQSLRHMRITSKGFQFLLEEVNTQLWDLLLVYLEESQDLVETIGFLFMLGSLELGQAYLTDNLSDIQLETLRDLADYGLAYLPTPKSSVFYPTRLATTLTSSAPPLVSSRHTNEEKGFIVLETNYKIYAYTSNPLQIAVLGLFAHLKTRFANFVTGHITRESVRRGLANGITANQASYLYDDFSSGHDYDLVVNYARELGALLLELPKARKVFVTADGHLQIREFIKRRMAQAQEEEAAAAAGTAMDVSAA
ncbi:RNA polymerase II transcription factor B subunit 2 [Rhodotorula sp. JG-1b]|nr:RNA polymerase II transcription factor B subunit 2 [Rhodotorula sp. JG-1b]